MTVALFHWNNHMQEVTDHLLTGYIMLLEIKMQVRRALKAFTIMTNC